jgi:hypothetical protein
MPKKQLPAISQAPYATSQKSTFALHGGVKLPITITELVQLQERESGRAGLASDPGCGVGNEQIEVLQIEDIGPKRMLAQSIDSVLHRRSRECG